MLVNSAYDNAVLDELPEKLSELRNFGIAEVLSRNGAKAQL
jgi:hypothetical protein